MLEYSFQDAKAVIHTLCNKADDNGFPTRQSFIDAIHANPHIAVQGYNAFCKIFLWNDASVSLYGFREDEAVNQDLTELVIPPEMRMFARDMMCNAVKTGKMPDAGACDLLRANGEYVTVYSGHLVFQWDNATTPEFYCIDLPIKNETE